MTKCIRLLKMSFLLSLLAPAVNAQTIVGVTDNDSLVTFTATAPGTTLSKTLLTGITIGQTIQGLDYRPATGELYALGYNLNTGGSQLYTVNISTSTVTPVGAPLTLNLGQGSVGFDFNPTVDRIRVVGANRSNYRLNPVTGGIAATDVNLSYPLGDPSFPNLPSVGAVAYTNSFPGLTTTSLYDYDESLNILALQNPPNNGTLNTIGGSGLILNNTARTTDLDIWYDPTNKSNTAYFIANTGTSVIDNLYTINLTTGAVTLIGSVGFGMKEIAVQPAPFNVGPLTGKLVFALAGPRLLISFDSNNPKQLRSLTTITGVDSQHTLVGMDFRPADGLLYALGYTGGNPFNTYRIYTVNTTTGVAIPISSGNDTMALGNTTEIGFDFNPTVDRIRVVSALTRASYRINPNNGLVVATDSSLQWTIGDVNAARPVRVSTVAYTKSYPGTTSTTLNGVNDSGAVFVTINPPNNGRLNTVASNIFGAGASLFGTTDLDFFYDSTSSTDIGYLAANSGTSSLDILYTLNPTTGVVTMVDTIGYGLAVSDIAVRPQYRNIPVGVGVASQNAGMQSSVYPNPAGDRIYLQLASATTAATTFGITDMTGRMMMEGQLAAGMKEKNVTVSNLPAGVYLLRIEGYTPVRFSKL